MFTVNIQLFIQQNAEHLAHSQTAAWVAGLLYFHSLKIMTVIAGSDDYLPGCHYYSKPAVQQRHSFNYPKGIYENALVIHINLNERAATLWVSLYQFSMIAEVNAMFSISVYQITGKRPNIFFKSLPSIT